MTTFRPIGPADGRAVFDVFYEAIAEVDRRLGVENAWDPGDDAMREEGWAGWRTLFEHVGATSDLGWLAEEDGEVVGYARSIRRGDTRELTEFFVKPGHQGSGIGREMLRPAFPVEPGVRRSIIATLELPALARYLAAGLTVQTMVGYFEAVPKASPDTSGLGAEPMTGSAAEIEAIGAIDDGCIGHRREVDHAWLRANRQAFVYRRGGHIVGYGYRTGTRAGPAAATQAAELLAILAHLETAAAAEGATSFGVWLPLSNGAAVRHVLLRGLRLDRFLAAFFADGPLPGFDRYAITSPPFFV